MKLKNSQILNLHGVLVRLEPTEDKCPKCGEPVPCHGPTFELAGQTRWDIVLNLKILGDVLTKLEEERVKMITARLKPGEKEITGEAREEFLVKYTELLEAETEISIHTITKAALFNPRLPVGTENQIPLRSLMILIDSGMVVESKP